MSKNFICLHICVELRCWILFNLIELLNVDVLIEIDFIWVMESDTCDIVVSSLSLFNNLLIFRIFIPLGVDRLTGLELGRVSAFIGCGAHHGLLAFQVSIERFVHFSEAVGGSPFSPLVRPIDGVFSLVSAEAFPRVYFSDIVGYFLNTSLFVTHRFIAVTSHMYQIKFPVIIS